MPAEISHPAFPQPDNASIKIWRYMDFAKYVAMLKDRALFFSRIDTQNDQFEGSLSKTEFDHWKDVAQKGEAEGKIPDRWKGKYLDVLLGSARRMRRQCYVSCWHMNHVESEAMWHLYSSSGYAIAITSTYETLGSELPTEYKSLDHRGPYLGAVTYTDHHNDSFPTGNAFYPIMHKRSSFIHENECRAVIWCIGKGQWPEGLPDHILATFPVGLNISIDLESMVNSVIVSPSAPAWFYDTVANLTDRYGYKFPVIHSSLTVSPYL